MFAAAVVVAALLGDSFFTALGVLLGFADVVICRGEADAFEALSDPPEGCDEPPRGETRPFCDP